MVIYYMLPLLVLCTFIMHLPGVVHTQVSDINQIKIGKFARARFQSAIGVQ